MERERHRGDGEEVKKRGRKVGRKGREAVKEAEGGWNLRE